MNAEHIIGLTVANRQATPESATELRQRYEAICASGVLRPRTEPKDLGEDGSLFQMDRLAGDHRYVFLSAGPRYRLLYPPQLCYGFIFDAKQLILECSAIVGPDLGNDYDNLIDAIIRDVDASLPPLPVDENVIAEFVRAMGETDPGMIAHLRASSASRYHDLDRAIRMGDVAVEGAAEVMRRFQAEAVRLQRKKRYCGKKALARLEPDYEILVPGELPLSLAVARIEAGQATHR